ncbi:flagellar protein FlaG [Halothermothrix orenii]|uniref:Flagellar protein FlaG protein n=1 Tax=Halothermothrix orenii (strain H 168 / OCM 544 / DSM 9562) TaxID=373903 RepID=B8CYT7_HALOH|nr:flagellar protein FlaG [Halothermothrix orenii]ACL70456.1 flagellar protein FlaG protein [Halothermothrix orenii H 168]
MNIRESDNITQPRTLNKINPESSVFQKEENSDEKSCKTETLNQKEINKALEKVNGTLKEYNQDLRFEYYEEADRMMVQVVDIKTQEVIKEIPPEELLDIIAKIKKMVGMVINELV